MDPQKIRKKLNARQTILATGFLGTGYRDYLSARVLLNEGMLLQGAMLSYTCVEKHIKAILMARNEYLVGHLKKSHLNSLKNFDTKLYSKLNSAYIPFLQNAYRLRYLDRIKIGYNLTIAQRQTLAELDYTFSLLREKLHIQKGEEKAQTQYEVDLENKNPHLLNNNYILNGIDKTKFIDGEQLVHQFMRPKEGFLEIQYLADVKNDGRFLFMESTR